MKLILIVHLITYINYQNWRVTLFHNDLQVTSWGAYLLKRNILTTSFVLRDTHEAQVQFSLEHGVPTMIGIMASERMSYPARSFDMAHYSRCLIPWKDYGNYLNPTYFFSIDLLMDGIFFSKLTYAFSHHITFTYWKWIGCSGLVGIGFNLVLL